MSASQATQRAIALAAAMVLAGCEAGQTPSGAEAGAGVEVTATANPATSSRLIERDVEAPEVFQVQDDGLWDGRPSLGGVWVAYSDVKDPERVIIRNDANGKFVIGALFRRERENPGPRFQVSSDAAAALGMLAGSPATLNVTALKREEPEPEAAPEAPAEPLIAADTISTAPIDGADPTASAEAAAEPERKGLFGKRKPKAADPAPEVAAADLPVEPAAEPGEGAALAAETTAAIAAAPERKGLFGKRKPEIAEPAIESASLDAAAPLAEPAAEPAAEATDPVKPARKGLFARRKTPEATGAPLSAISAPVEVSAVLPAPKPAAKSPARSGGKDYIQIGIFSVESNAENTATALRRDGMAPTVRVSSASGKQYWRVVVGPAGSAADRAAVLRKVKALGFADAYLVSG